MKAYLLYLLPKKTLYAITTNDLYLERFLSERNRNLFDVQSIKLSKNEGSEILSEHRLLMLERIPLESSSGNCDIIGTITEDNTLSLICETMAESCEYLKLHFTKNVPFNIEYIELLDSLTTISQTVNNHPIIQVDSVKLFYYLFKNTFMDPDEFEYEPVDDDYLRIYDKYGVQ